MITATIRFVSFLRVDLRSDVSLETPRTMKWTIIEPAMYQIAATLPTLRPILTKILSSINSMSLFSRFSSVSRQQKSEDTSGRAGEATDRNQFVKLDDYHYMHDLSGAKELDTNYSGVLKTTNVSVSSHTVADAEEHDLTRYAL